MASRQSNITNMQKNIIVSFILVIGHIELTLLRWLIRWSVSIICIILGITISYATFYFFQILPSPTKLSQYQLIPSIAIYDHNNNLLYKEWNTPRSKVSERDTIRLKDVLPPKEDMAWYLANHSTQLSTSTDKEWYQKKILYLYSYNSVATAYTNAKVFQYGVVGGADASEIYFQKNIFSIEKDQAKQLMSLNGFIQNKKIYARMPTEISSICTYMRERAAKKTGWLRVDTTLDMRIGAQVAYQLLINPDKEITIIDGGKVRAWTQKDAVLLAARAITKTTEGGEKNE